MYKRQALHARDEGGDLTGALADFDAVLAARADPLAYKGRGQARARAGDLAGAIRDFEDGLAAATGSSALEAELRALLESARRGP